MSNTEQQSLVDLTKAVINVLDTWKLQTSEMQQLLGLPDNIRARAFQKYREGREQLPNDELVLRKAAYLIRIEDALRTTYPRNPFMGGRWIRQKHRRLGGQTPLSMILESENQEASLIAVLSELDCTFAWDMTGSKHYGCN